MPNPLTTPSGCETLGRGSFRRLNFSSGAGRGKGIVRSIKDWASLTEVPVKFTKIHKIHSHKINNYVLKFT